MLLQTCDLAVLTNLAPIAKTLLERGGFKIGMQTMDRNTQAARQEGSGRARRLEHLPHGLRRGSAARSCEQSLRRGGGDRAQFGWPQDEEIERLRMAFLLGTDPNQQFSIARQVQQRMMDLGVTVPLGPYVQPLARRKNVSGNIEAPMLVFRNVDAK